MDDSVLVSLPSICFQRGIPLLVIDMDAEENSNFVVNPSTDEGIEKLSRWLNSDQECEFNGAVAMYIDPFECCSKCPKYPCKDFPNEAEAAAVTDEIRSYLSQPLRDDARTFSRGGFRMVIEKEYFNRF